MLRNLLNEFIDKAHRPMDLGFRVPVNPKAPVVPLVPRQRWAQVGGSIRCKFTFRRSADRDEFIVACLAHEAAAGHNARLTITEGCVEVLLTTHGVDSVTELDREYARSCDASFKELTERPDE